MTSLRTIVRKGGSWIGAIRPFPAALLASAIVLAACGDGDQTVPVTPVVASPAEASRAPSVGPSSTPSITQTNTEWGRIWDGLPPGFPKIPGATPDEDATGGPASAVFVVDGTGTQNVAGFLLTELQEAGYKTVGSTEPLEDGSYVLDMTGTPDGCMLQATVKPTGGQTTVTILYGTDCPFG